MNIFNVIKNDIGKLIEEDIAAGRLPDSVDPSRAGCEPPRDSTHGDIASNAAMVLAKTAGMNPRALAETLALRLRDHPWIDAVSIAGPGFINLRLKQQVWTECLRAILQAGTAYGESGIGAGEAVNVEYVSANPTGPMHVGHARGAVVGDVLASLLAKAGYAVHREYYINDAGVQVDILARSLHWRYREALGEATGPVPDGLYPGDYLIPVAEGLVAEEGDRWREQPESAWLARFRTCAIEAMMRLIRDDLAALGIVHDLFVSERALVDAGRVDEAFALLQSRDLIYRGQLAPPKGKPAEDWEPREQTLFRATLFGDDQDRPLMKSDGSWTYFASDMAYHLDKARRGFSILIDVWGADHGGYVKRMAAAVKALTEGTAVLDVKLCQLVHLLSGGEPVKMSKRSGTFVTLREVVDEVGKDVVRFIMLTRSNDAPLDFDLQAVTEQTRDNPVFYVQYAHARACSVLRNAAEQGIIPADSGKSLDASLSEAPLDRLDDPDSLEVLRRLAHWPRVVESAALAHEPHRIAYYLEDLAAAFHGLWNKGNTDAEARFLVSSQQQTQARLALARSVALVLASGLGVLGVEPAEEMR